MRGLRRTICRPSFTSTLVALVALCLAGRAQAELALTAAPVALPARPAPAAGLDGGAGLLRLPGAQAGPAGQLTLALSSELFTADRFLLTTTDGAQDHHRRWRGSLAVAFTPNTTTLGWQLHGSLSASSNRNQRFCGDSPAGPTCANEPGRRDPNVIRSFGDLGLGTRLARPLAHALSAGVELDLLLPASVTGLAFDANALTVSGLALLGWDAAGVFGLGPRVHLGAGYVLDRSRKRVDLAPLPAGAQVTSMFAYGMSASRARAGLGLDWAVALPRGLALRPMAEYQVAIATAKAQALFASVGKDNRDAHALSFGLGFGAGTGTELVVGADVALRSPGLRYGPRLPPLNLVALVSQSFDTRTPKLVVRTVTQVVAPVPHQGEGALIGAVTSGGKAVAGAVVAVAGVARARVATDGDGGFRARAVPPGPQVLEITAPGFRPARREAKVLAGQDVKLDVELEPSGARLTGQLVDASGAGVEGQLVVTGAAEAAPVATDPEGRFSLFLPPGTHRLQAITGNHLRKAAVADVSDGKDLALPLTLRPRAAAPGVEARDGRLTLRQPLTFVDATLDAAGEPLLDEVVDLLLSHPELHRVRVEAHWDRGADVEAARRLTEQQARVVASYLVRQGVPEERLVPIGLGADRPLRGARRSSEHRRIELVVID